MLTADTVTSFIHDRPETIVLLTCMRADHSWRCIFFLSFLDSTSACVTARRHAAHQPPRPHPGVRRRAPEEAHGHCVRQGMAFVSRCIVVAFLSCLILYSSTLSRMS
jgi:hypothetical protein